MNNFAALAAKKSEHHFLLALLAGCVASPSLPCWRKMRQLAMRGNAITRSNLTEA
jgi:hypothetical protein